MTIRRRLIPYWLLAPGLIWLVLFFVIPMYYMGELSLKTGSLETGYQLTWAFENYTDSISEYSTQFIRAFWYAGVATFFCLLIGYPLAYAIAFKAGRWKNLMLFAVV
ncbi:MAG: ABC transporter permease, partial [Solirubrobacterales bacterium]